MLFGIIVLHELARVKNKLRTSSFISWREDRILVQSSNGSGKSVVKHFIVVYGDSFLFFISKALTWLRRLSYGDITDAMDCYFVL